MSLDKLKNKEIYLAIILASLIKVIFFIYFLNIDLFPLAGDQDKYWQLSDKIFSENFFLMKNLVQ